MSKRYKIKDYNKTLKILLKSIEPKINEINDANIDLVEIKNKTPHCKLHGSMNKLTKEGIWRCVSTYAVINFDIDDIKENNCKAGCEWIEKYWNGLKVVFL